MKALPKEKANVGDMVDMLVKVRDGLQSAVEGIDEFVNVAAKEVIEKGDFDFTAEDLKNLPWIAFTNKRNQVWERISLTAEHDPVTSEILEALCNSCMTPEATIRAPFLAFEQGYWVFNDSIYRKPMPIPK